MLKKSSPLKQLGQMEPNLALMVPGCVPFKMPFGSGELKNDEKRGITPRRVIRFTSKLQGM
jgi:hypothetical protein